MTNRTLRLGGQIASLLGLAGLILAGCSKSNTALEASGSQAFQAADAPTKAVWGAAVSALRTNGYAPALLSLQTLATQPNLSAEQSTAVTDLSRAITDQLFTAASRGDANAIEALKQVRSNFRR